MKKREVDVNDVINLTNELHMLTTGDIRECEFIYDGVSVTISPEEIEEFRFTGLGIQDFILSREWGDE